MKSLVTIIAMLFVGCSTGDPVATVLAIRLPVWVPSYAGHLSVEDAAAIDQ